ncbi:MAG TPA: Clp protease N-terminal domain-containing protein [Acidimicrobiales bacterium]|nr:Clp protease N-terminal domain-containing protein [Acidimicrobiales bacterium]
MPKINVYLPDALAEAVKEAQLPVSSICQAALESAVQKVQAARDGRLYSRFTARAKHVLELARDVAQGIPNEHVDTVHLLVGIVDEGGNLGLKVLESLEIEPADLRAELMGSMPPKTRAPIEAPEYAPGAMRALELTAKEAMSLGHNYIGCEHILLGVLATEDTAGAQVLARMGVDVRNARRAVVSALSGFVHAKEQGSTASAEAPQPSLDDIVRRLDAIEKRLEG